MLIDSNLNLSLQKSEDPKILPYGRGKSPWEKEKFYSQIKKFIS